MLLNFFIVILVVGFVTGGIKIRFDRFFTILMLMFVMHYSIRDAVDIFLWVLMFGALMILLDNRDKIAQMPKPMKTKMFVMIPIFTLIASFIGSWLFVNVSDSVLIITLGILAILLGARLVFIHFKSHELEYEDGSPLVQKLCGLLGPWISGISIGFIGTSLKPLKIAYAIKLGKMNIKKVYLGNTMSTFFAAIFTIMWHHVLVPGQSANDFYQTMLIGMAAWTGIHFIYELTTLFFKPQWQKAFQIFIGIILMLVSIKIFALA